MQGLTSWLSGSVEVKGLIAVVACDKPPVGTLAAVLEHNEPAVFLSDGSIRPGTDPDITQRRMFGGIAFLHRGNMAVGVTGDDPWSGSAPKPPRRLWPGQARGSST